MCQDHLGQSMGNSHHLSGGYLDTLGNYGGREGGSHSEHITPYLTSDVTREKMVFGHRMDEPSG